MGRLFKTEAITYFGNVPVGMFQQSFGFIHHPFEYMVRGGFARHLFDAAVEMVEMHCQLVGKIRGRTKRKTLRGGLDRELALEQLDHERWLPSSLWNGPWFKLSNGLGRQRVFGPLPT